MNRNLLWGLLLLFGAVALIYFATGHGQKLGEDLGLIEEELTPEEKAKRDREDGFIRGEDAQGLVPSSDQAVGAARDLHRRLHGDEEITGEAATVRGKKGSVILYLKTEGEGDENRVTYFVRQDEDGYWRAYEHDPGEIMLGANLEAIGWTYLKAKYPGADPMKYKLTETSNSKQAAASFRFLHGGDLQVVVLTFENDPDNGWHVVGLGAKE